MATKELIVTMCCPLPCCEEDSVLIWVNDPSLLTSGELVEATITQMIYLNASTVQYTLEYDDAILVIPGNPLLSEEVKQICCYNCNTQLIEQSAGGEVLVPEWYSKVGIPRGLGSPGEIGGAPIGTQLTFFFDFITVVLAPPAYSNTEPNFNALVHLDYESSISGTAVGGDQDLTILVQVENQFALVYYKDFKVITVPDGEDLEFRSFYNSVINELTPAGSESLTATITVTKNNAGGTFDFFPTRVPRNTFQNDGIYIGMSSFMTISEPN